ncbi:MAG: hypothetical protein AAGD14_13170 [Planctomycetota bacterium]
MRPLLALLALASFAFAKDPLPYARTPKEAVEMARTRGKLIFITVCVDNDEENRATVKNVLHNKKWQKIAREFVLIYANKDRDHGSVMVKTKSGKKEKRDADVPELTNDQVVFFAYNYVAAFYPEESGGQRKTPIHFIVSPDEDLIEAIYNGNWKQGFHHVPADKVIARMKAALKKYGKGISEKQYAAMQKSLTDAKAARARDNTKLEISHLLKVTALPKELVDVKAAQARLDALDKEAKAKLGEAEELIRQLQWEDALDRLETIKADYAGVPSGLRAATRQKELMRDKEVKRVLRARDLYEKGMQFKKSGKLDRAEKRWRQCVKAGPGTKWANKAQAELDALGAKGE